MGIRSGEGPTNADVRAGDLTIGRELVIEAKSYRFDPAVMEKLLNLARRYNTSVDNILARAVATELYLDGLPEGSKLIVEKPDGKYEELVRPDPQAIGA
jgi:hypothetical protein